MSFFRNCTLQLEAVLELNFIASGGAVLKMGVCIMGSNLSTVLQTFQIFCVQSSLQLAVCVLISVLPQPCDRGGVSQRQGPCCSQQSNCSACLPAVGRQHQGHLPTVPSVQCMFGGVRHQHLPLLPVTARLQQLAH